MQALVRFWVAIQVISAPKLAQSLPLGLQAKGCGVPWLLSAVCRRYEKKPGRIRARRGKIQREPTPFEEREEDL